MCLSCGCNKPNERHGDDRNIVMQDLQDAATAAEVSTSEVVKNIQSGFEAGDQAGGRTVGQTTAGANGGQAANREAAGQRTGRE